MPEQSGGLNKGYEHRWSSPGEGPKTYTDDRFNRMIYRATGLEGVHRQKRILDWMSGPGKVGLAMQELSGGRHIVFFLDRSEAATTSLAKAGEKPVRAEARMIPFPNDTMDLVVARYAIKDLPADQQSEAFKAAAAVLKPGGKLVIADMITAEEDTDRWINKQHLKKQVMSGRNVETEGECNIPTEAEWKQLMRDAGFHINNGTQTYVSEVNTTDWVPKQITQEQQKEMDRFIMEADDKVKTLYHIREESDGVHIDFPVRIFSATK